MKRAGLSHHVSAICLPILCLAFVQCEEASNPTQSTQPTQIDSHRQIVLPVAGADLLSLDTVLFQWTGLDNASGVLPYYRISDDDTGWTALQVVSRGGKSLRAVMPPVAGDTLTVRLMDAAGEYADGQYHLAYYHLTVAPGADARYKRGDTVRLAWRVSPSVSETLILLISNDGKNMGYITGAKGVAAPTSEYLWVIGNSEEAGITYPASGCTILIHDYFDPELRAASKGTFAIE